LVHGNINTTGKLGAVDQINRWMGRWMRARMHACMHGCVDELRDVFFYLPVTCRL